MSRHHRRPVSQKGKSTLENISIVCENKHRAWHLLFDNHPPEMIAKIINAVWLDPDYEMVAVPKLGGHHD
ncbi:MAG: hypothetical protein COW67_13140 [Flavobacteriales bacterium CG18_big_fil_WC_8_21_14_2_50_32_9]|nr:MAG: hypothetical protein COW67_13140 [Flavobacteriales bacterium CG18_big_fil_WC_8_21_14_2_50_32_9]